jgi:hypothetical protein
MGLIARNPADAVKPPKVERAGLNTLDMPQTAALIGRLHGTRMLIPAMLAVLCGLRRLSHYAGGTSILKPGFCPLSRVPSRQREA